MSYSESGTDSNFAINSALNFASFFSESKCKSNSESESESFLIQCIWILTLVLFSPIFTLLNEFAGGFFYPFSWPNQ